MRYFLAPRPLHGLQTTFLDVGQGDGIFFRTRHGVILLDGGSTDQKKVGQQVLEPYLKSNGISKVSYAIVSHGDQDHISGLSYLLESGSGIQIQNLILPIRGKEDPNLCQARPTGRKCRGKGVLMKQGDQIRVDGLSLRCLYDGAGTDETERNNHSLLIQASYGDFGMLLTGDNERRWGVTVAGTERYLGKASPDSKNRPSWFRIFQYRTIPKRGFSKTGSDLLR